MAEHSIDEGRHVCQHILLDQVKYRKNCTMLLIGSTIISSGIVSCYNTMKRIKNKKSRFNVTLYVIQRVIRILPLMSIFIILTTLLPHLSSGPVWNEFFDTRIGNCYRNWWKNLLFIHNFVETDKMVGKWPQTRP